MRIVLLVVGLLLLSGCFYEIDTYVEAGSRSECFELCEQKMSTCLEWYIEIDDVILFDDGSMLCRCGSRSCT